MAEVVVQVVDTELLAGSAGWVRMAAADLERLEMKPGEVVLVVGRHVTAARIIEAADPASPSEGRAVLDSTVALNAGVEAGDSLRLRRADVEPAEMVELDSVEPLPHGLQTSAMLTELEGLAIVGGDRIRCVLASGLGVNLVARKTSPSGVVLVASSTELRLDVDKEEVGYRRAVSYDQVGGLEDQLERVRELVELPLRHPEIFEHLGIDAPRGVLLHGPPGCGKTLIARAIAHESEAAFFPVSGPEIIHHFYGESEAHLRNLFQEAAHAGPSVIFLDEIDAIAPRRDKVSGEVEKRLVAQLLALMDGLTQRERVLVIAATNLPNAIDPALRRPGRFDREIVIPPPDRDGRRQILEIHSRRMPLTPDVDLEALASVTHGYVGADLAALCREAAMARLRRSIPRVEEAAAWLAGHDLEELQVAKIDFLAALVAVGPSALRELIADLPEVTWNDIGGLSEAKEVLREAVEWPLLHPEAFEAFSVRPSRGILLTGPPGSGKTLLAQAVASASGANFIVIRGPELYSRYVGESEKSLREIFHKARMASPCVLFFDEVDGLFPKRGSGSDTSEVGERLLGHFLAELDGVEDLRDVLVLAASNRPDRLDPALVRPGRFDRRVELKLPDEEARREIFEVHLRGMPVVDGGDVGQLSSRSAGSSGADIAEICRRDAFRAIRRFLREEGLAEIQRIDLEEALEEMLASFGTQAGSVDPD